MVLRIRLYICVCCACINLCTSVLAYVCDSSVYYPAVFFGQLPASTLVRRFCVDRVLLGREKEYIRFSSMILKSSNYLPVSFSQSPLFSLSRADINIYIQSTLVISTSVISNNRLSRRKNLVLVITQKSKIRL